MLSITKDKERKGWNFFRRSSEKPNPSPILEKLDESLGKELKQELKQIDATSENLPVTKALHLATDNLSNVKLAVEKSLRVKDLLTEDIALILLDEQIERTKTIVQSETVSRSNQAIAIGIRTLNLLFCAKQLVKQKFSVVTPLILPEPEIVNGNGQLEDEIEPKLLPSAVNSVIETPQMRISSTLLFQLHHSLFPAERMLVGAGKQNGQTIEIDGIFDVTGQATSGYVKADANRLARALIVMSETEKHFALWIHSHPGRGKGATHPSSTDTNQEAEWLKDYSPNLVNAIIVEDRFIRFWGRALDKKRITVKVTGTGIRRVSESEEIYQLEF